MISTVVRDYRRLGRGARGTFRSVHTAFVYLYAWVSGIQRVCHCAIFPPTRTKFFEVMMWLNQFRP